MTIGIEGIKEASGAAALKVVGVGGGGGNAVNRMISCGLKSVDFVVANTDSQDLKKSLAMVKLQIGSKCTLGLGAGAKPDVGREAALEDMETIRNHLTGSDMVFITAGLGGGTGTGAAPVIAEVAKEMGILTVGVVTKPFKFEGKIRQRNGEEGIISMRKQVDTLIVIPNDNLLLLANKKTSILDAFTMADDVLRLAVQGISDLINNDGLINLDFADVRTVMSNMGHAIMGTGIGSGDSRAAEAAEKAISSPLLEDSRIDGAKGILINITGPSTMGMHEVQQAASYITDHADPDANIIFGARIDPGMEPDHLEVTVIAAGFDEPGMSRTLESDRKAYTSPGFKSLIEETNFAEPMDGSMEDSAIEPLGESMSEPLSEPLSAPPANPFASSNQPDDTYNSFSAGKAMEREPVELKPVDPMQAFQGRAEIEEEKATGATLYALPTEQEDEDEVYELQNPIMEPVQTTPQVPSSYRPEEKIQGRHGTEETDWDIPTFIRNRSKRFAEE